LPSAGLLVSLACVVAVPAWELLSPVRAADLPAVGTTLPPAPRGWSHAGALVGWNPVFTGSDRVERAEYSDAQGRAVSAYAATYASQHQNKELVAYGNSLVGEGEGVIVSSSAVSGGGAREIVVDHGDRRSLIRFFYLVGQRRTERGVLAQVWYGLSTLRGGAASSVVALRTPCVPDCDAGRALLDQFRQEVR
jgi:EpsI family protein